MMVVQESVPPGNNLVPTSAEAVYPFGWTRGDLRRFVVLGALTVAVLMFLWNVQSILPPFIIAFFLAALLDPSVRYMEARGRSRGYAILVFYVLALAVVVFFITIVVPLAGQQIAEITNNLGAYTASIQNTSNAFLVSHAKLLHLFGIHQTRLNQLLQDRSGPVQSAVSTFLQGARSFAEALFSRIFWFVIIPVAGFFFMRDYPRIRARLIWLCPEPHHARIDELSSEVVDVFSAYLRGLAKICALYGFSAFVMFLLLNVHFALFLGLLAGVFYAVPYIGNLITATSAATIAYLMAPHRALLFFHVPTHSLAYALLVAACCILLANVVFDQMVYPRVVGGSVGLHPVVSIFALAAGATLFGVWGMLLATPVAASIQIVLTTFFPRLAQAPPKPADA